MVDDPGHARVLARTIDGAEALVVGHGQPQVDDHDSFPSTAADRCQRGHGSQAAADEGSP
jgi:hypothetical protein